MSEQEIIQGSDAWLAIRCGKVTASRMADLTARTKSGWGASRANYMAELVVERLTGVPAPRFQNDAMRWGQEKEPEARAAYEFNNDVSVQQVGFVSHPRIAMAGCSPDGFVGPNGMIEIKAPNTATHLETLLGAPIPDAYMKQMAWQMACCDREWCDWMSYDPRLPPHLQIVVRRVHYDPQLVRDLERDVSDFIGELEAKLAALERQYGKMAA